jgi:hypothetical protein
MTSIEAVDEFTIEWTTEFPFSNFPDMNGVWMWKKENSKSEIKIKINCHI